MVYFLLYEVVPLEAINNVIVFDDFNGEGVCQIMTFNDEGGTEKLL